MIITKTALALILLVIPVTAAAAESVTLSSLLKEMVDRETIARFPQPRYTCRQASSYDRDSDDPQDASTWYANADRSQFVRTEEKEGRKEFVMMDAEGPGAIVRFWATWHGPRGGEFSNGTLRIYLDGSDVAAIEGPISDILDRGALAEPPLSQSVSPETPYPQRAHNLYLPIPYAKHCKVTYSTDVLMDRGARQGEALYYQINYRTYAADTEVESFSMDRLAGARPVLDDVQAKLRESEHGNRDDWQKRDWQGEIGPGEEKQVFDMEGPRAIRCLRLKIKAADLPQALRSTILKIDFDGEQAVWAPVGDFFGTGYKIRPYASWYTEVTADRVLSCWWVMPFEKSASISLHNVGDDPVEVQQCDVQLADWKWDDRSMHFRCTWKQLTNVETRTNEKAGDTGAFDVNYVTVKGKGVYAGDTLTVFNGAQAWWGEGDEKIYVDGEEFPSHFGTGTEDYYGYAWCRPEYFAAPFHAQPDGGGNLAGGFSVNSRYRMLDAIPFDDSLRFDMELWHWAKTTMNYAPTTFFYARPGATTNVEPDAETAATPVVLRYEKPPVQYVAGAIEGEDLEVVRITGGKTEIQDTPEHRWSGDQQIWWIEGKPGDELELEFPVETPGRYRLFANLTKAGDYAIVEVLINGQSTGETYDRYHNSVDHDRLDLGIFDLKAGTNSLTLRIVGANPAALKRYMAGVDYLKLESVK